jgi:hypothetical protein
MAPLPLHRTFFARSNNQAGKLTTRMLNWIYLAYQTRRLGYVHVSTKLAKSVFKDACNYYYVYRHINMASFVYITNPTSLLPTNIIKQRIFVYPVGRAATATDIDTKQAFDLIDVYFNSKPKQATTLGTLLEDRFNQKIAWQTIFKQTILGNFDTSTPLQIGLCHCDLTQDNFVFHQEQVRIIDWDDSCDYIIEYDKIYYCFMTMMNAMGKMNYADSFKMLGLKGCNFNADLAISQLGLSCQGRFSDLNYLLFLMMFAMKAGHISPIASHLWSKVRCVVYKGKSYVRQ